MSSIHSTSPRDLIDGLFTKSPWTYGNLTNSAIGGGSIILTLSRILTWGRGVQHRLKNSYVINECSLMTYEVMKYDVLTF